MPRHVAIIMDGNNRWARRRGLPGPAGHRAGVEAVRGVLRACQDHGVDVLTLFAFSSENWGRPRPEVRALLALLSRYLRSEVRELHKDGIRLRFIGQRESFQRTTAPADAAVGTAYCRQHRCYCRYCGGLRRSVGYRSGGAEAGPAVQEGSLQPGEITPELIDSNISISDLPRPDLCIRTGGDARISNFMLWHFAYSELYFTNTLWPDFDETEFARALADYSRRERRFGLRDGRNAWPGVAPMLKQRVITALIMVGLFPVGSDISVATLAGPDFCVLICLGAWEWSRLCGWESPVARAAYVLVLAAVLGLLYVYCQLGATPQREQVQPFLGLACLWWSLALLWVKGYPGSAVFWRTRAMRNLMGLLVLAPAWMSAVYLVSFPRGGGLIVVMVLVVASADIGAYFAGRAWGKHKLAEVVSPKKTWEGFWGGMAASSVLALLLWSQLPPQQAHISLSAVMVVSLVTALASVVGDLTVSMVKREAGVKDSGSLLPGHGGMLDRLDSLCGAAPVFALGLLLAGW